MKSVDIIMIDDEQHCLNVLQWELDGLQLPVRVVGAYTDPKEGLNKIVELKPDLVLLDIEMPSMSGFELLQHFDPIFFNVIFTTAYEHYAIDAIKSDAIDYLLKPIQPEELKMAILRHQDRNVEHLRHHLSQIFRKLSEQNPREKKIVIPTAEGLEFLRLGDIIRCESSGNYCYIFLRTGSKLLISKTLKDVEELIDSELFGRVHQSHLINLDAVLRYTKADGGYIEMVDQSKVPVSRNKKSGFFKSLS